jgi:hypothetical protein
MKPESSKNKIKITNLLQKKCCQLSPNKSYKIWKRGENTNSNNMMGEHSNSVKARSSNAKGGRSMKEKKHTKQQQSK